MPQIMIKNAYLSVLFILFSGVVSAQIGINTESPLGSSLLHIDAKRNTSGSSNTTDDVVVSSQGYLGVGTTNPASNLSINGTFRMNDGTQRDGYVLVSNADGIASWQRVIVNRYVVWRLSGSQDFEDYGVSKPIYDPLQATSALLRNEIVGCSESAGVLTLPAGRYLFSANGDQAMTEYGTVDILMDGTITHSLLAVNSLGGGSFIFTLTAPTKLQLNFTHIDVDTPSYSNLPFKTGYSYVTTIIQLENI